ncbi:MAG: MarR family winged helix-turn-helix transcriptional regulator [Gemmatimonadaceae bacterium]
MSPDLRQELKQEKPVRSLHQEAQLNLVRTANLLVDRFEQMLKPYGITATQYNVLRILRGAEPAGLCRHEVSARLLNRMPDATRLLDRMEDAGLVTRARGTEDRRMVKTHITGKGLELVDSLDETVEAEHLKRLGHLSGEQLATLVDLMTLVRSGG